MKKLLSFIVITIAMTTFSSAQTFKDGDNVASLGVGFIGSYGVPITLGYERGIYDINETMSIGVGGKLGLGWKNSNSSNSLTEINNSYSNFLMAAVGNYHYTGFNRLDLYGGLSLGLNFQSCTTKSTYTSGTDLDSSVKSSATGFLWGLNVGARYYFNDFIAAHAELGYGISVINIGVSFKF